MRIPGSKRTARAPDGRRWRVGRRWTGTARPRLRGGRQRDDWADAELPSTGQRSGDPDGDGVLAGIGDAGGDWGIGDLFDADAFAVGLVAVVAVGLLFLLLFPLLEALIVLVLLAAGVASRVVLRRPWRVEARLLDGDPPRARAVWHVVGFRRSGRVAREIAEQLAATGELPSRPPLDALPQNS